MYKIAASTKQISKMTLYIPRFQQYSNNTIVLMKPHSSRTIFDEYLVGVSALIIFKLVHKKTTVRRLSEEAYGA